MSESLLIPKENSTLNELRCTTGEKLCLNAISVCETPFCQLCLVWICFVFKGKYLYSGLGESRMLHDGIRVIPSYCKENTLKKLKLLPSISLTYIVFYNIIHCLYLFDIHCLFVPKPSFRSIEDERKIFDDIRNRVQLNSVSLPSVCLYTVLNAHNGYVLL